MCWCLMLDSRSLVMNKTMPVGMKLKPREKIREPMNPSPDPLILFTDLDIGSG